jgi:hypothetical protein
LIKIPDLSEKAMLVRLSISQWTARKYDKNVSKKVEQQYNAHDSGRYNKNDIGDRILPSANFHEYSSKMRELKQTFRDEVNKFVENYDDFVNEAKERLNGMFAAADYPHREELPRRYSFNTFLDPLPRGNDFRVSLNDMEVEEIQQEIEERLKAGQQAAMKDLWSRLNKVVSCMVERLTDEKAVFRDSLIDNARDLVLLLPRLNITGDLSLEKSRREIEAQLLSYTPQTLRTNKIIRKEVAEKAEKIRVAMAGYTG